MGEPRRRVLLPLPPEVQILSFSCSYRQKKVRHTHFGSFALPSGKSWIRHWKWKRREKQRKKGGGVNLIFTKISQKSPSNLINQRKCGPWWGEGDRDGDERRVGLRQKYCYEEPGSNQWADLRGCEERAPPRSKFFHFHAVFGKF